MRKGVSILGNNDCLVFNLEILKVIIPFVFIICQQESTNDKVTRISDRVMHIENEMERDRIALMSLQNRAMNETLQKCKDQTKEEIHEMKLQMALYQVEEIKQQVNRPSLSILSFLSCKQESHYHVPSFIDPFF